MALDPALVKALEDSRVRWHAAEALDRMGPAEKEAALIKALEDSRVRWHAAEALGWMGPAEKEAVPALIKALEKDSRALARWLAADALHKLGPAAQEAVPALVKALEDEFSSVRVRAADALGRMDPAAQEAVPALVKTLDDERFIVRVHAASALGRMGPAAKKAVPALIKAFEDSRVRRHAAEALGQMGPETAVPALIMGLLQLKKEDQLMRWFIESAFYRLVKIERNWNPSNPIRSSYELAIKALDRISPLAPGAAQALRALTNRVGFDGDLVNVASEAAHIWSRFSPPPVALPIEPQPVLSLSVSKSGPSSESDSRDHAALDSGRWCPVDRQTDGATSEESWKVLDKLLPHS